MKVEITLPETIDFNIAGETHQVKTGELPETALVGLLMYGRRKANDTFNSAKGGESPLDPSEVIDKIKTWDFGQGGSRVSPLVKAQREVVKGYLESTGMKTKDATKLAKEPLDGFRQALILIIAKQKDIPANKVPAEDIIAALDKNWPKVEKQAQAIVDAANATTDLDI